MTPKKCWYCAYLGKCEAKEPCEKFKSYEYKNEVCYREITGDEIATILGIWRTELYRRLKVDYENTIKAIRKATHKNYTYDYIKKGAKRKSFFIIPKSDNKN